MQSPEPGPHFHAQAGGAPPEHVIVRKLQFFREGGSQKHLRDIRRMLESLGDDWRRETLHQLIGEQGVEAVWEQVLAD